MKINVTGVPESIEVDGKTYPVSLGRWGGFVAYVKGESVQASTLAELPERIQANVRADEIRLAEEREIRRIKREATKKVPVVWALYNGTEKVQVRGKAKTGRFAYDTKLLITRADGSKETVSERSLSPITSDRDAIVALDAERKLVSDQLEEINRTNRLEEILKPLRFAPLDVTYREDGSFFATYGEFEATGKTTNEVEQNIIIAVVNSTRPFTTEYEEGEYRIVSTLEREDRRVNGYEHDAFATREEAEQYIALNQQSSELAKRRGALRDTFDYEAELEKVRAALSVVNGGEK